MGVPEEGFPSESVHFASWFLTSLLCIPDSYCLNPGDKREWCKHVPAPLGFMEQASSGSLLAANAKGPER